VEIGPETLRRIVARAVSVRSFIAALNFRWHAGDDKR